MLEPPKLPLRNVTAILDVSFEVQPNMVKGVKYIFPECQWHMVRVFQCRGYRCLMLLQEQLEVVVKMKTGCWASS